MVIRQLASGNYTTKVYIGRDSNGKSLYKSVTAPTKSEVKRMAAEVIASRREAVTSEGTIGTALAEYVEQRSNVLAPSTLRNYRLMIDAYTDALQDVPLRKVSEKVLQEFVNRISVEHSPKTVRNVYSLIASALKSADKRLTFSVDLPQKERPSIVIPTDGEVAMIMDYFMFTEHEIAIDLCCMCGLRRGEVCALEWSDFDSETGLLTINKALSRSDDGIVSYKLKATKTQAGMRRIRVPETLRRTMILRAGAGRIYPYKPLTLYKAFKTALRELGLPDYRLHDLRHYTVSVMLSLNIPKNYIAEYVGHNSEEMIDRVYGHIMRDKMDTFETRYSEYFDTD